MKRTTAIGECLWCKINGVLDTYEGNILGYSVRLKLSEGNTKALTEELLSVLEEAKVDEKFKGKKWSTEPFLGISEDAEGNKLFKFKSKHEFEQKDGTIIQNVIPLYDAKGKRMADNIIIGNGSKIKISYTAVPFNMNARTNGLTLRLNAIQVIDLVEYNSGSSSDFGFTAEEGYESPAESIDDCDVPF